MALDEALLDPGDPRPVLRLYTWDPPGLSLGYFQRWAELAPLAQGQACVRRFTGGGAIHHAEELTFSIAADLEHPLYRCAPRESYERVHAALARAFATLGVDAHARGAQVLTSERAVSGMCFHHSTPFDLVWDGAKGVGSAQRRRDGRVLHHGSIKLGRSALEPGVACLRDHRPGLTARELAPALLAACEEHWRARFEHEPPAEGELQRARQRAGFYRSLAFLQRR